MSAESLRVWQAVKACPSALVFMSAAFTSLRWAYDTRKFDRGLCTPATISLGFRFQGISPWCS